MIRGLARWISAASADGVIVALGARSTPGKRWGSGPVSAIDSSMAASSRTYGVERPICNSQSPAIVARTVSSSASTQRAFRGVARARHVPGLVFSPIAHVEDVRRARRVVAPPRERGAIDRRKARPPGEGAGSLAGALTSERSGGRGEPRRPALEGQALELPATGAVPERIDLIGHAGGNEARGPEDSSGAGHAIDHHLRRRSEDEVVEAAEHLAGRRIDAAGNVAGFVLAARGAVDEHPVLSARERAVELASSDKSRSSMSRDEIAEPLGGHLDLGEQGQSRGSPRRRPTGEHGHVLVAELGETAGGNDGEPFATVRNDDPRVELGDQPLNLDFDVPKW